MFLARLNDLVYNCSYYIQVYLILSTYGRGKSSLKVETIYIKRSYFWSIMNITFIHTLFTFLLLFLIYCWPTNMSAKTDQPGTNENVRRPGGLKTSLALTDPQDRSSKRWENYLCRKFLSFEFQSKAEGKKALSAEELIHVSYLLPKNFTTFC